MGRTLVFLLILCSLVSCSDQHGPIADSRRNDFALYDEQGSLHRLSYYNDQKAIVLFVQGNGCPIVRSVLTDFRAVMDDYSREGFKFFMINSNIQDSRENIAAEALAYDFRVPVLVDRMQLVADALDITITAEAEGVFEDGPVDFRPGCNFLKYAFAASLC